MSESEERWKPPPSWSGYYEASDRGNICGVQRWARTENQWGEFSRTVPAKTLRPFRHTDGHLLVALCRDGVQCKRGVAALVLEAWVGPRPPGHYVEHINGDFTDCRLANLRWAKRNWGGRGRKLKAAA